MYNNMNVYYIINISIISYIIIIYDPNIRVLYKYILYKYINIHYDMIRNKLN